MASRDVDVRCAWASHCVVLRNGNVLLILCSNSQSLRFHSAFTAVLLNLFPLASQLHLAHSCRIGTDLLLYHW
jgi:hypothetical protein